MQYIFVFNSDFKIVSKFNIFSVLGNNLELEQVGPRATVVP